MLCLCFMLTLVMHAFSSLLPAQLAPQSPNMCLQEELHYAPVSETTHKSQWSWATISCIHTTTTIQPLCWWRGWVASKAGLALIERKKKILGQLFMSLGTIRSKKADCCRQFDHPFLGMGSSLPHWNSPIPGGLRLHWTGEVGTVIISWANPKSLPISCTILNVSLEAPILGYVDMLLLLTVS